MPRLFIGIKIHNPNLELICDEIRKKLIISNINWVPAKNFHLTIKFLGEVDSPFIEKISSILTDIASKHKPFNLYYNQPGFFGSETNPKVMWFDFKPNQELNRLQLSVDKSLTELGFKMEVKAYIPHLTFARVKKYNDEKKISEIYKNKIIFEEKTEIKEFQLFQSNLKKEGPEYSILASFKLETIN
jgi:2'-5' RNA ligase